MVNNWGPGLARVLLRDLTMLEIVYDSKSAEYWFQVHNLQKLFW